MDWVSHSNPSSFQEQYVSGDQLGEGSYAVVVECTDRTTGKEHACKIIKKASIHSFEERNNVGGEVAVLRSLQTCSKQYHPYDQHGILQLKDVFETEEEVRIVTELCAGGTLFDLISAYGPLPESSAKIVFHQLLRAVDFCHSQGVLHRDIKPENIFFTGTPLGVYDWSPFCSSSLEATVRLGDFGFATFVQPGQSVQGAAGNLWYTALEIHQRKEYGLKSDVWSLGVTLCFMLTGQLPYSGETEDEKYESALEGRISWETDKWTRVSPEAKRFLQKMLQRWPSWRCSAKELASDPWLRGLQASPIQEACSVIASKSTEAICESPRARTEWTLNWVRLWGRVK